jgi:hypothetical protein
MKGTKIEVLNKHCKLKVPTRMAGTKVKGRTRTRINITSKKVQRKIKRRVNLQRMRAMARVRNL